MVTVFGILNLTEDSFFDESRRLDPAGAVTAAIEMLRVGSDVVDVGPAASHPDARPVSPADEIRRIAPLLDALSDQMHRVSIDSFQPETQRYALKRGVGYLNDIQGFPDPALYPDIAEADCRLVVMHSAQRDGIATRTGSLERARQVLQVKNENRINLSNMVMLCYVYWFSYVLLRLKRVSLGPIRQHPDDSLLFMVTSRMLARKKMK